MMYRTKTTKCFVLPSIHFFIRVMGNETLRVKHHETLSNLREIVFSLYIYVYL